MAIISPLIFKYPAGVKSSRKYPPLIIISSLRVFHFTTFLGIFEFLISISWRYLIPENVYNKAKHGAINLHRGDLPRYAGVEPIKRALKNNEKQIAVCCHHITSKFDDGEVIFKEYQNTNYQKELSLEQNVERLKREITRYFPKLTIKTLEYLLNTSKNE